MNFAKCPDEQPGRVPRSLRSSARGGLHGQITWPTKAPGAPFLAPFARSGEVESFPKKCHKSLAKRFHVRWWPIQVALWLEWESSTRGDKRRHPEAAESSAKRRTPNEGPMHFAVRPVALSTLSFRGAKRRGIQVLLLRAKTPAPPKFALPPEPCYHPRQESRGNPRDLPTVPFPAGLHLELGGVRYQSGSRKWWGHRCRRGLCRAVEVSRSKSMERTSFRER